MESWKYIPGYEGAYQISTEGRVRSVDRYDKIGRLHKGRELSAVSQMNGYKYVTLYMDGKQNHVLVHRAVAGAFIDNPEKLPEVNHINENKADNSVGNLEWCTHVQNHNYGSGHKRSAEKQGKRVIQYDVGGNVVNVFPSIREAARHIGRGHKDIYNVCRGRRKTSGGYRWEFAS